jgi:transposase-like protein
MAKKILSPDEMAEARRLYEKEGWGYGRIASKYSVSKPTVQGWAKNWQRDYGVAPLLAGKNADAGAGATAAQPKVTGNAVPSETQAGYTYPGDGMTSPGRDVAGVFVSPAGRRVESTPRNDYADEMQVPADLDDWGREAFVAAAIVARQRQINAKHIRELTAARAKLYGAIKGTATKEGPAQALASQRNIAALLALQQGEMDAELQRVKLEVAEFVGRPLKPQPCRIVVHLRAGEQLVGGAAAFGPNAFEVVDQQGKVI